MDGSRRVRTEAVLVCEALQKKFGKFAALDGVYLDVKPGEIVGLLGPNGAGKTTFMRLCEGRETPTQGRLTVMGVERRPGASISSNPIGILLQKPTFSAYATVTEIVALFSSIAAHARSGAELIEKLNLTSKADTRVARLSGGQRQRLGLLVALLWNSDLMLLDEPTSELDPQGRRIVWDIIVEEARERGAAILLSTHQMEEAAYLCDRVYVLDAGRIVANGTPSKIIEANCPEVELEVTIESGALDQALLLAPQARYELRGGESRFTISCSNKLEAIALLRTFTARPDIDIRDVQVRGRTLEDVFFHLTGTHLRT